MKKRRWRINARLYYRNLLPGITDEEADVIFKLFHYKQESDGYG
jgi:hypothetical protein